jgi:8-oxo-dGTP pyrophosphatase MutT (NUDIX family)
MFESFIVKLKDALAAYAPETLNDPSLKQAAVLVLVSSRNRELCVLFTKRTEAVAYHKGEISFPGGARDCGDSDLRATALRETEEELGIKPSDVIVMGELDDIATGSGFCVRPFVGVTKEGYTVTPNRAEIDSVIEVPLQVLLSPESRRAETRWINGRPVRAWSFVYQGHLIWGATGRIVDKLGVVVGKAEQGVNR